MPRVELVITLPSAAWIGEISRRYPDARFRVLSALPNSDGGTGLLEVAAEDPEPILADIREADLRDVSVLARTDADALVQFETASPMLLRAVQSSGVPVQFPFEISEGKVHWELTVSHDRLSALRSELEMAKSTLSGVLRRAEAALARAYVDGGRR